MPTLALSLIIVSLYSLPWSFAHKRMPFAILRGSYSGRFYLFAARVCVPEGKKGKRKPVYDMLGDHVKCNRNFPTTTITNLPKKRF